MMTNREKYASLVEADEIDELLEISGDDRCAICDREIEKNLCPTNPACEGNWCKDALEYWLNEPASEE